MRTLEEVVSLPGSWVSDNPYYKTYNLRTLILVFRVVTAILILVVTHPTWFAFCSEGRLHSENTTNSLVQLQGGNRLSGVPSVRVGGRWAIHRYIYIE